MIKVIGRIIGYIRAVQSISGKINNPVVKEYPELEDLEVTPSATEQNFKSEKYGYDNVKVKAIETEEIIVTPTIEEQIKEGVFSKVTVKGIETEEITITPSKEEQVKNGLFNKVTVQGDENLVPENIPQNKTIFGIEGTAKILDFKITNASYLFYNGARLDILNELLSLCENIISTAYMFYGNRFETLDLSNLDTSNVEEMSYMFYNCTRLKSLDLSNLNTSKVKKMNYMISNFYYCESLDVSSFNTSNVEDMSYMFYTMQKLKTLDLNNFDLSKVKNVTYMFKYSDALETLHSFKNLGKGYTQKSNNNSSYKLDLSSCTKLTHDSLIDILTNGLYDLNLSYDVANGGTLYKQSLVLGSTNLAKLTEEEIAIATNKGWNVS